MYKTSGLLVTSIFLLAVVDIAAAFAQQGAASTQIPVRTPFNSIEVRNGGHVMVRPAPTQRVTLVKGSLDYSRVAITDGGALVIDKCIRKCPRGYQLEVEISAPTLTRISLANGGRIQSSGSFPRQGELAVAVSHGGTIDVRSMMVDRVTAAVEHGGRILTVPRTWLSARVAQGGVIIYWGDGQVTQSVEHGGVVSKGSADQINLPHSEVDSSLPSFPSLPSRTKKSVRGR